MILWKQLNLSFRRACHRSLISIPAFPACDECKQQLHRKHLTFSNGHWQAFTYRLPLRAACSSHWNFTSPPPYPEPQVYCSRLFREHLFLLVHYFLTLPTLLAALLKSKCRHIFSALWALVVWGKLSTLDSSCLGGRLKILNPASGLSG